MRRSPIRGLGDTFSVSSLKHFDDQTMAVLAALKFALGRDSFDLANNPFHAWGVLAAPRNLGRALMGPSVVRFHEEGAWGVSPHLIPHHSLHSISGTASQFLKARGPNFGIGGGLSSLVELLLTAPAMLVGMRLPGLWLVFSQVEPEWMPCETGRPHPDSRIQAIAMAIVAGAGHVSLEVSPGGSTFNAMPIDFAALSQLIERLNRHPTLSFSLNGKGDLTVKRVSENLTAPSIVDFPPRQMAG